MIKRFSCLLLLGLIASAAMAQVVSVPYVMSFEVEDATELANWHLNPGAQAAACSDEWMIGMAVRSDGKRSLYVHSNDSVLSPSFGTQPNLQFVYRDFELPAGTFNISFDWLNAAPASAPMYVGYVAYKTTLGAAANVTANSTSGTMPAALTNANNSGALYGKATWQSYTFPTTLTARAGTTYRFYVAWANNCTVDTTVFGACIDNIQITDARCLAPRNITAQSMGCDSVLLNWVGSSDGYQIQYRKEGQNAWSNGYADPANPTSALLEGLSEGNYSFRVRGICHDDQGNAMYSAWANYEEDFLIYCTELHCITYFDLDLPGVTCTYGSGFSSGYQQDKNVAYQHVGKIDYGPYSEQSRHTVNWDKTATDPRTNGLLKLIPGNAIASVRLGNWKTGGEAESVSFQYTVDSAMSILLLKYAVVLEDPDHPADDQPRFVLEILDENGQLIDPTCGAINFAAHAGAAGWQTVGSGYNQVTFKDWSTIGLNLQAYSGQNVTIRLTTYDCAYSGHFGYAYFTLDCAGATLTTTSCGEQTSLTAEAPEGFNYEWSDEVGNIIGTTQVLNVVTTDTVQYTCRLINKEEPTCWFELSVRALPQFPVASFTYKYDPQDCKNRVVFTNSSFIQTRFNGQIENHYDELGGYAWDFGDGETSAQKNNIHIFPQAGGTYEVTLSAWIAEGEGACRQDTTILIVLPEIGNKTVNIDTTICQGSFVVIADEPRTATGVYTEVKESAAGCVITTNYNLTVHEQNMTNLPDTTICFGDVLTIDGTSYEKTTDGEFVRYLLNRYKCDSTVVINVHYTDPISPDVQLTQMSETVLEATVDIAGTGYSYYTINGGAPQTDNQITGLDAGIYTITFFNEIGCETSEEIIVTAPCLRDLIYQRWDDVLSIKNEASQNPKLNGGKTLSFVGYQWKKDGVNIEGANKSYYYEPGGLSVGASYTCEVTMADGTVDETCPYRPVPTGKSISITPTHTTAGQIIRASVPESCRVVAYNTMGLKVFSAELEAGDNYFEAPSAAGIYILDIILSDGKLPFRITVTE